MWEEHPWYQKQQARTIGLFVIVLVLFYAGFAITHRDWPLLRQVLMAATGLVIAIGLLSGITWLIVKLLARRAGRSMKGRQDDEH